MSAYNTAGVLFFLILHNKIRAESIKTCGSVLGIPNIKVLSQSGKTQFDPVSGVKHLQRTENRKQMTDDKGQTDLCHLISDFCYLTAGTAAL